jgi:hypothetical protein
MEGHAMSIRDTLKKQGPRSADGLQPLLNNAAVIRKDFGK